MNGMIERGECANKIASLRTALSQEREAREKAEAKLTVEAKGSSEAYWLYLAANAELAEAKRLLTEAEAQIVYWQQRSSEAIGRAYAAEALVEAALDPFADVGSGEGCEDYPDNTMATLVIGRMTDYSLTLGDFRRAAALSSSKQKDASAPTNTGEKPS